MERGGDCVVGTDRTSAGATDRTSAGPSGSLRNGRSTGPSVQSAASGLYVISGLDPGPYKVGFSDGNPSPRYLPQWFVNHPDAGSADPLMVIDGVDTPVPDVTLALGVTMTCAD